jgi:hypothetical protein
MRILGGLVLALALASCYGRPERPIGAQPTPLSVKSSGTDQQALAPRADVQGSHSDTPDASELAKNGANCSADSDCSGRLRCVSYTGVAGRELKQCLFPCGDGCPTGWNCQITTDGPSNTCARAR